MEWHNNASLIRTKAIHQPRLQIRTSRLAHLLTMIPNLTVLTLRMELRGPDPCLFDAIRGLPNLKCLGINLPPNGHMVSTETKLPLFAQLEKLCLGGSWYYNGKNKWSYLPAGTSWKIKRLMVDPMLPLLGTVPS
ncbi:hypothetical protein BGX23_008583 [Mortierella sp. AD031]|nr:hypothetical protein BGX23_008583 [Mortierella sp. AD031]